MNLYSIAVSTPNRFSSLLRARMASYASLKDRVSAAGRVGKTYKNEEQRAKMMGKQTDWIIDVLGKLFLNASEVAEISEMVVAARFGEELETQIQEAILAVPEREDKTHTGKQDYTMFCNYLTDHVWGACGEDPEVLNDHLMCLGLRDPNEPTIQMMIFATSYQQHGLALATMTLEVGNSAFLAMKRSFKDRVAAAEPPISWYKKLPALPATLLEVDPTTYQNALGEDWPIECPIPLAHRHLVKRFPQRMGIKKKQASASAAFNTRALQLQRQRTREELDMHYRVDAVSDEDNMLQGFKWFGKSPSRELATIPPTRTPPAKRLRDTMENWSRDTKEKYSDEWEGFSSWSAGWGRSSSWRARDAAEEEKEADWRGTEREQALVPWRRCQTVVEKEPWPDNQSTDLVPQNKACAASQLQGANRKGVLDVVETIEKSYGVKKADREAAKEAAKIASKAAKEAEKLSKKTVAAPKGNEKGGKKTRKKGGKKGAVAAPVKTVAKKAKVAADAPDNFPSSDGSSDSCSEVDDDIKVLPKLDWERSRSQVLVRTGIKGTGQSLKLPYTDGPTQVAALQKGRLLCRKMCRRRGLAIPEKFNE
jgi:hypothetical protein